MTKKQIVRFACFSLIVVLMMLVLCDIFKHGNDFNYDQRFYTYRKLNEDTIDAVFIGSSGLDRYWIPAKAYEEYGMSTFTLSADALPAWLITNVIKEAQQYHDPQLFILDIRSFTQDNTPLLMDVRARRLLDAVPFFSKSRLEIAFKTMEMRHQYDETIPAFDLSYLLPFIKYHSKWEDEGIRIIGNLGNRKHKYGAFYVSRKRSLKDIPQQPFIYDETYEMELDPVSEKALYDLLDYIRENDLEVLFLDTPQIKEDHEAGRANVVYRILEEEGFNYLHYFTTDEEGKFAIDLDYERDFYNSGHVNYYGAEKFTDAFSAYLNDNYDLPDRRGDERCSEYWDGIYDYILDTIADGEKIIAEMPDEELQAMREAAMDSFEDEEDED